MQSNITILQETKDTIGFSITFETDYQDVDEITIDEKFIFINLIKTKYTDYTETIPLFKACNPSESQYKHLKDKKTIIFGLTKTTKGIMWNTVKELRNDKNDTIGDVAVYMERSEDQKNLTGLAQQCFNDAEPERKTEILRKYAETNGETLDLSGTRIAYE